MARKKSINDLVNQLCKFEKKYFLKAYHAYNRAFEKRFGFAPHTNECKLFIQKYGKDLKV